MEKSISNEETKIPFRHRAETCKDEWQERADKALKRGDLHKYNIARFNVELKAFRDMQRDILDKLSKETDEEVKKELRVEFSGLLGQMQDVREELRNLKRNKTGSSYYEFTPSRGNRRQRRS